MLQLHGDEGLRADTEQENFMHSDKNEDEHLINADHLKTQERCDEKIDRRNAVKNWDDK